MKDIYAVFSRGGDGHSFLGGLIAHSFLNWNTYDFPKGDAHLYWFQYINNHTTIKSETPWNPKFTEFEPKDTSSPYIVQVSTGDDLTIKNMYINYSLIGITITPDDYHEIEINHFLKMWGNDPITPGLTDDRKNDVYDLYNIEQSKNSDLPLLTSASSLKDLPTSIIAKILKKQNKRCGYIDDFLEDCIEKYFNIPYTTLTNDAEGTLSFVEKVTEIPRTPALIQTVTNYQNAQKVLKEKYSELYDKS